MDHFILIYINLYIFTSIEISFYKIFIKNILLYYIILNIYTNFDSFLPFNYILLYYYY